MLQLVIIADDFTGALDTGVQFVNRGAATCVLTGASCDFSRVDEAVQVLVVNAESRHLSVSEAYNVVFRIAKTAEAAGIPYIYKKTDSALRGNIGCELNAVMDASGEACLIFAPAFPQMGRVTRRGIHYIDGVPVADSVFGKDPFEPVTESSVREIVRKQSDREIVSHSSGQVSLPFTAGIHIFDAEQKEDLDVIAKNLLAHRIRLSAGCAAFAAALADQLNLKGAGVPRIALPDSLIVV